MGRRGPSLLSIIRAAEASARRREAEERRIQKSYEIENRRIQKAIEVDNKKRARERVISYKSDRQITVDNLNKETKKRLYNYSKISSFKFTIPKNIFDNLKNNKKFSEISYQKKTFVPSVFNEFEIASEYAKKEFGKWFIGLKESRVNGKLVLNFSFINWFLDRNRVMLNAINSEIERCKVFYDENTKREKEEFERCEEEEIKKFNQTIKKQKDKFELDKQKHNNEIAQLEKSWHSGEEKSVVEIFRMIIANYLIPEIYKKVLMDEQFSNLEDYVEVFYKKESKILVINAVLPNQKCISREIDYKYISSRDEITFKEIKEKDFIKLYDNILSQVVLLYVKLAFETIADNAVKVVNINGYVKGIDPSNGKKLNNCVVSVSIPREKFIEVDLDYVDSMHCLNSFKARIASEFINIAPVSPIIQFDKHDNRFIESDNIIDNLSNSLNLAAMDWEKFEYLVRDLFSKMFSEHGAEVKVTQASRDKGVDAVIFDPDPIRGGKFIIQCKRYNNVVSVSDVRDLWGTVMHEGASKGILVTTSRFGSDSIEWAKDKPITLINGQNLLSLFQKYGYDFRIELQ